MRALIGLCLCLFAITVKAADAVPVPVYTEDKLSIMVQDKQPEFTIKLKSNPTTGYSWFLRSYDSNVLSPVKHHFVAATDKHLVGAPGYELWTFRVKSAGFVVPQQTLIRFVYVRPWEVSDRATQYVFRVTTR